MTLPQVDRAPLSTPSRPGGVRRLLGTVSAAVLVLGAAACGTSDPATPSPSSTTSPSQSSSVVSSPPVPSGALPPTGTPALSTPSVAPGGATTLSGTVEAGVESGCIVLIGPDGAVLANLIGMDAATAPMGGQVEVTGKFQTDMMTTCQQGGPFAVAEVIEK
jgi:hypothetical protein